MKTRTVTERIGERLGDIDWSYDFRSHCWGTNIGGTNPEFVERAIELLRQVEEAFKAGKSVKVRYYEIFEPVIGVGMYDGWPYWRPVPSVCSCTWLGASWHCFTSLMAVQVDKENAG